MWRWAIPVAAMLVQRAPLVVLVVVGHAWVSRLPRPKHALAPRSSEEVRLRDDTDVLREADVARREGRWVEALSTYERVLGMRHTRPRHRDAARYWHARLRLEAGERSACMDLAALVEHTSDPRRVVQSVLTLVRERSCVDRDVLDRVIAVARRRLRARADVETSEGRRAERWYVHLNARLAGYFPQ